MSIVIRRNNIVFCFVNGLFTDDYIQTMTISKPKNTNQIKVSVQLEEIGNMSLHISNLLRGRVIVGKFFDIYLFIISRIYILLF